jgi:hypothetical protein
MNIIAQSHSYPAHESALSTRRARNRRRRQHLRHIHPMTHEQQIALIEEARAARSREQNENQ